MPTTLEKHQLAILVVFIPLVFKMAMLPCLLYDVVGSDMWISVALLLVLEILQLFVIVGIQKLGGIEHLKQTLNKPTYCLILLPLICVFMVKALVFFNEIVNYVSSFLFYNISDLSIKFALLAGIAYLSLKGVKAIGRISELSLIFVPFIFIIGLSFGKIEVHLEYLLPVFENGVAPIAEGAWKYLFYAFDFSPLIFIGIAEKKKSPRNDEKGVSLNINHKKKTPPWFVFGSIACFLSVIGAYILFIASYGESGYLIDNAFARLASFNVVTTEIGSIDWPTVILWLTMAIITVSLKIWGIGVVGTSFKMRRETAILGAIVILGLLSMFALKNVTASTEFVESWWRFVVVGIEIGVTLAVFFILLVARKMARKKPTEKPVDKQKTEGANAT